MSKRSLLDQTKDVIFFGDKTGCISVWDALAPPREIVDDDGEVEVIQEGQGWRIQFHWPADSRSSVSALKFDPIDAHSVSPLRSLKGDDLNACLSAHLLVVRLHLAPHIP